MGGICSKDTGGVPAAAKKDNVRRPRQELKRKSVQEYRRPSDSQQRDELEKAFEAEGSQWPQRPQWYKEGKWMQGISIMFADPEPLRDMVVPLVLRNKDKYNVTLGFGNDTGFDPTTMRLNINCSTVSGSHCKLNFRRDKSKLSVVEIEDLSSLNGTFILARPGPSSKTRPLLEREVRNSPMNLETTEYIRLGSACVLAMECTNIFWDDAEEEDEDDEVVDDAFKIDLVEEMLKDGWYFPAPTDDRVKRITQKKRADPKQAATRTGSRAQMANKAI